MWLEIIAALLAALFIVYKYSFEEYIKDDKKSLSYKMIPGLEPSHPIDGNNGDIEKAGTISTFIKAMHKKHGPIVRFYEGTKMAVSIAAPEMLKQVQHLFESPTELFEQFSLLTGHENFSFCDVDEIKRRRKIYDQHFMMSSCKAYSDKFRDLTKEILESLEKAITKEIALKKVTENYSLNALLRCFFGDAFNNEKTFDEYQELIDFVFKHLHPKLKDDFNLHKEVTTKCNKIRAVIQIIMDERKAQKHDISDSESFIDVLLNMDISEEACKADVTGFISGGYFVVSTLLSWFIYELALHPEIQEKIYQEIGSEIGNLDVTVENMHKLTYLRQTLDETFRIYLSPTFTTRIADTDLEIGNYHIPKGTAIYLANEPLFNDPKVWKDPKMFDPDRFSQENSRGRDPYSFKPFGFAGNRICPGMSFAISEIVIFASEVVRRFYLSLVPGQTIQILPGFMIAPKNEIMIFIKKR